MAKVISDIDSSRKITFEFTEKELATIVFALGTSIQREIDQEAAKYSIPCSNTDERAGLWLLLEQTLLSKEAVVFQQ